MFSQTAIYSRLLSYPKTMVQVLHRQSFRDELGQIGVR